ncbi:MAG: response regulator [Deltaproteobacteria bacterium]|nr:response regulator [Deltaproteobacteria bacterium]
MEDDPTVSKQLRRYMEELDAEVLTLPHGTGVITQAETFEPDVILLDIILPTESGWKVLEQLKTNERTREIPVVIVSVLDEPQRGLRAGAVAVIVKPARREQLYTAIAEALAAARPTKPEARGAPRILLAEDNEMNIVLITDYLEAKGFDVRVARDGVEALEALRTERPDLVLMDMQMPRMDGMETMQRIRADRALRGLPIIALTALAMTGDKERILEAGADEYVSKPVNMRQLVATMKALLVRS